MGEEPRLKSKSQQVENKTNPAALSNQEILRQIATDLGVSSELQPSQVRTCWIRTTVNGVKFEMELFNGTWRLIVAHGDSTNSELIRDQFPGHAGKATAAWYTFEDPQGMAQLAAEIVEFIAENELGRPMRQALSAGVSFVGSNFEGYGERDFMAALVQIQSLGFAQVIPGVGDNLKFEFQVPSVGGRIDAVETDEKGGVLTVIEAQSGIQHGDYLDDEHFAKSISRYPYAPEVKDSVQKVVVIAGGYTEQQVEAYKHVPFQVSLLKTAKEGDRITLVEVFSK